jgi:hypothetical protein
MNDSEVISFRTTKKMYKELELESKAFHAGRIGSYVVYLLENHPTRSVNLSIARSKKKKN